MFGGSQIVQQKRKCLAPGALLLERLTCEAIKIIITIIREKKEEMEEKEEKKKKKKKKKKEDTI